MIFAPVCTLIWVKCENKHHRMPATTVFNKIIKEHEALIYKVARAYAPDEEDRKDLYQEIVYQLWKSFPNFRKEAKVSTWMYRVALNTSITHAKKAKKNKNQSSIDIELLNIADDTDHVLEERVQMLYAHIQQLNLIEKGIILLFLEGKSYEEIANITGLSPTNIGTRLSLSLIHI